MMRSRMGTAGLGFVLVLALAGCQGAKDEEQAAGGEPTAPSSEWVAENPTEAAVPVDLPKTEMTMAPPASESPPAAK